MLTAPPIPTERFLRETFSEAEWARPLKPDGSAYALGFHGGYDMQSGGDDRLLAGWAGEVWYPTFGAAFGKQIAVEQGRLSLVYAHCAERVVFPGRFVFSGAHIADMGWTGLASPSQKHLHFTVVRDRIWDAGHLVNPGGWLRQLQEAYMPLSQEDLNKISDLINDRLKQLAELLVTGTKRPMFPSGAAYVEQAQAGANLAHLHSHDTD